MKLHLNQLIRHKFHVFSSPCPSQNTSTDSLPDTGGKLSLISSSKVAKVFTWTCYYYYYYYFALDGCRRRKCRRYLNYVPFLQFNVPRKVTFIVPQREREAQFTRRFIYVPILLLSMIMMALLIVPIRGQQQHQPPPPRMEMLCKCNWFISSSDKQSKWLVAVKCFMALVWC